MKKKPRGQGKTRTREHVIADLATNYLERWILLCGHTVERTYFDYGIDLYMRTFNTQGEAEYGTILIQVKATDRLQIATDGCIRFRIDRADLKLWLKEGDPLVLVVYDAKRNCAFWLNTQAYFAEHATKSVFTGTVTIRIPYKNRLNRRAIRDWVQFRDARKGECENHEHD